MNKMKIAAIASILGLFFSIGTALSFLWLLASTSSNVSPPSSLTTRPTSTTSTSTTSSYSSATANSTLYFIASCVGCSVPPRGHGCLNIVFGSWIGKRWYQNEFGGYLDYYQPQIGIVSLAVFGNATASFRFPPYGDLLIPPDYRAGYQGSPIGAGFGIISCTGTLNVKLMAANGSVIWQATAYPHVGNNTIGYLYS